jgi:hypothetical protein
LKRFSRVRALSALSAAVLMSAAATVHAQSVSDTLTFLVTNQSVQTGSVERDRQAALATSQTISRALLANLATLPVPSSSGGFIYRLNGDLGTVERVTEGFGPSFVERALTAGKGQVSLGITFQHLRFNSLDGQSLRDGTLVTTANQFVDEDAPFDVDQLTLAIDTDVATFYGNIGVTDAVEVGFAVPMVSLMMNGSRVNVYRGREFTQATAEAHAVGLADIVARAKVTAYRSKGSAIAGAVDLRLPTGRTDDLLGAGTRSFRFAGIGSIERGAASFHGNGGFTVGGLADEIVYGGAVALAANNRLTILGELMGRHIDSPSGLVPVSSAHPSLVDVETIRLTPGTSKLEMVTLVPGFKWNLTSTWVLAANVTVPLTHQGLTAPFTPFVGLDYAIGQ